MLGEQCLLIRCARLPLFDLDVVAFAAPSFVWCSPRVPDPPSLHFIKPWNYFSKISAAPVIVMASSRRIPGKRHQHHASRLAAGRLHSR